MTEIARSIDLKLPEKLRDREYRQRFFLAESSARIAEQIIKLRKRRGLNQKQVAEITDTHQPAISRAEQADYQNWSFSTLRKIADALDARIRVLIEPSEDVLQEYDDTDAEKDSAEEDQCVEAGYGAQVQGAILPPYLINQFVPLICVGGTGVQLPSISNFTGNEFRRAVAPVDRTQELHRELAAKDAEIAKLKADNSQLRNSLLTYVPGRQEYWLVADPEKEMPAVFNGQQLEGRVL